MHNKSNLRIKAKNIRKTLDIQTISTKIINKIINHKLYISAKNVMIYYPLEDEINLLPLMKNSNKNFYLPKMNGQCLDCCPYKIGDTLICSKFNVKEPLTENINPDILDIVFTPALMVDKNNNRLGYGKGFYDIFLDTTKAKTITVIAKELIIDTLPTEAHDKKIDIIITQ